MRSQTDTKLLAQDVYMQWRRRVAAAEDSVVVFTPFMDRLVQHLLGHSSLPPASLTVVTDLSPESGARDYRAQLLTIRSLLKRGFPVRSLPRLHAKVLLTDKTHVTLGSQNFTSYARRSRECTAVPALGVDTAAFVEVLREWLAESTPVDLELVEALLDGLEELSQAVSRAQASLTATYVELSRSHEEVKAARWAKPQRVRVATLQRESRLRLGRENITASVRYAGEWNEYRSLIADSPYDDLTLLMRNGQYLPLQRLRMLPVMLADSGRMGFARVAQTRITYVRDSVKWTKRYRLPGFGPTRVHVECPQSAPGGGNLRFRFILGMFDCTVETLFSGDELRLLAVTMDPPAAGSRNDDFAGACRDAVESSDFFAEHMKQFKFERLGVADHNIASFLDGHRYRIGLLEYARTPVMVLTKIG